MFGFKDVGRIANTIAVCICELWVPWIRDVDDDQLLPRAHESILPARIGVDVSPNVRVFAIVLPGIIVCVCEAKVLV